MLRERFGRRDVSEDIHAGDSKRLFVTQCEKSFAVHLPDGRQANGVAKTKEQNYSPIRAPACRQTGIREQQKDKKHLPETLQHSAEC